MADVQAQPKVELEACEVVAERGEIAHAEWLDIRRQFLGGSDAAAVCGVNDWKSSLSVWASKVRGIDQEMTSDMKWGNILEPIIRQEFPEEYAAEAEDTIEVEEAPKVFRSIAWPFMGANLDGIVTTGKHGRGGLEIKTANLYQTQYWKEGELPRQYYCQVQHYMAVTGLSHFLVVVLLGKRLQWRFVPRNEEYIQRMVRIEQDFWREYIENGQMPIPKGLESDRRVLLHLFPSAEVEETDFPPAIAAMAERYDDLRAQIKEFETEKEMLSQAMKAEVGDAKGGRAGKWKVTWSRFERASFDRKRFREEHGKLYARYTTQAPSERLSVTRREEKNGKG